MSNWTISSGPLKNVEVAVGMDIDDVKIYCIASDSKYFTIHLGGEKHIVATLVPDPGAFLIPSAGTSVDIEFTDLTWEEWGHIGDLEGVRYDTLICFYRRSSCTWG